MQRLFYEAAHGSGLAAIKERRRCAVAEYFTSVQAAGRIDSVLRCSPLGSLLNIGAPARFNLTAVNQ